MQKAAFYIRVSTDEQTEYSPDAQKSALLDFAQKNKLLVENEHIFMDEGISGRKAEKRPAFMRMIGLAKRKPRPFDVILVHKFDRFARNREDSVVYKSLLRKECGIKVISITEHIEDDKFAIILESMLEAMAEYYSLNLSDEVKKGMVEKAKRGEHSGTSPLGYYLEKDSKILQVDSQYSEIIPLIFHGYVYDNKSLFELSKYLNLSGYMTKNNKPFSKRTLEYIIQNPVYCGYNRWNYRKGGLNVPNPSEEWIIEKGDHEPLIDKELWDKAQKKLCKHKLLYTKKSRPASEKRHWLSGLLHCSTCGGTMTANLVRGKYISFRCSKYFKGSCGTPSYISGRKIENYVLKQIEYDLNHMQHVKIKKLRTSKQLNELDMLEHQLKKIEKKYQLANKSYLAEIDTIEDYRVNKLRIKEDEERIIQAIETYKIDQALHETLNTKNKLLTSYELLQSNTLSIIEKHKIARSFIKVVTFNSFAKSVEIDYYIEEP